MGRSLAKVRAQIESKSVSYDVVSVEAPQLAIGCDEGLFEKLPADIMADQGKYLPGTIHPCGLASDTWATVMVYDGNKLKDGPKSWAEFWDVEKFPGKRGVFGQALYTLENALMADGVKPAEVYKARHARGRRPRLRQARPDQAACRVVDQLQQGAAKSRCRRGGDDRPL